MKKIKRFIVVLPLCALFIAQVTPVFAQTSDIAIVDSQNDMSTKLRADNIEWRFKVENGKLYKRQYNSTKQVWIGAWVLIP